MNRLDRRKFLKLMGKGTAALGIGMGLSESAWAQQSGSFDTGSQQASPQSFFDWNDWEFYFPGVYDREDTEVLKKFQADLGLINNKNINIDDLISGKLEGNPGIGRTKEITAETVELFATIHGNDNPLWTDENYAKKTKWGGRGRLAMPFAAGEPLYAPGMPREGRIGDYMVVTHHHDTMNYYRPVYEGDTIYRVNDNYRCIDTTPVQGSYYRTFAMFGSARLFNQKGELVAEGTTTLNESFRRHKDPAKRNQELPQYGGTWEAPDWWTFRPPHIFTDKDWEEIKDIWKNEKIRGDEPMYWDDVNIGDEPPPRAVGPIFLEQAVGVIHDNEIPEWNMTTKQNMLDPKAFKKLVKNEQGLYVPPGHLNRKPKDPEARREVWDAFDGRGHIQNAIPPKWAAGMIYNWMGDDCELRRIGWEFMGYPPGSSEYVNFQEDPTLIPSLPKEHRPVIFDKLPYLDKVPCMWGQRAAHHALGQDLIICRAYVTNKYRQGNEYFVDLVFWNEAYPYWIVESGFITVKLPKK